MVIYEFVSPSGKRYIGRATNFNNRLAVHKYRYAYLTDTRWKLYDAMRKYGWDEFEKNIIEEVETEEEAIERELYYIKKYDAVENGYNLTYETSGGGDMYDEEMLKDMKERLSEMMSGDGNPMYGKNHKEESISKMKKKAKGRFSLPWYIDRYGKEEGTKKYNQRCKRLSERKVSRDKNGKFT